MKIFHRLVPIAVLVAAFMESVSPVVAKSDGERVIAIDVLLVPETTMTKRAGAVNAKLRENYSEGYTLGKAQIAHISLVHRYVREKDLPAIEEAVQKTLADYDPRTWVLTATGIENGVWAGLAIATITIKPAPELSKLQVAIVKAIERFAVTGGTTDAFSRNSELPKIDSDVVNYVEKFVVNSSGDKYKPHVTVGVAHEDFVKKLEAAPFETFSFKPAGVAIYQLGNFGTAQQKLWEWRPK